MITGFNTDVKHNSKVYHVQTEDKGRNNPKIETLVYMGGEILDSHRTVYDDDRSTLGEEDIIELMESQHKNVIKSIKLGKYDPNEEFPADVVSDRGLDEVIKTFLETEQPVDPLKLAVTPQEEFSPGATVTIPIQATAAKSGDPVDGVGIKAKLTSKDNPPVHLFAGKTDQNGELLVSVSMPAYQKGEAAFVVQAISAQGTAQFRLDL